MMPAKDIAGHRYGRLFVIRRSQIQNRDGSLLWDCQCDCGNLTQATAHQLCTNKKRSCGCFKREILSLFKTTHGKSGTRLYFTWNAMMRRCYSPLDRLYHHYGGRGIVVCERWHSFNNFLIDMGEKPPKMTLERVDVNGNYCPNNCIWASQRKQVRNRRNTIRIYFNDQYMPLADICEQRGVRYGKIYDRIFKYKWDTFRAITEP